MLLLLLLLRPTQKKRRGTSSWEISVLSPQAEQNRLPTWERTDHGSSLDVNPTTANQQTEKIGVLLLNLGGPETLDDVQPFLYNLFNDDSIIRLPAQGTHIGPLSLHLQIQILLENFFATNGS